MHLNIENPVEENITYLKFQRNNCTADNFDSSITKITLKILLKNNLDTCNQSLIGYVQLKRKKKRIICLKIHLNGVT